MIRTCHERILHARIPWMAHSAVNLRPSTGCRLHVPPQEPLFPLVPRRSAPGPFDSHHAAEGLLSCRCCLLSSLMPEQGLIGDQTIAPRIAWRLSPQFLCRSAAGDRSQQPASIAGLLQIRLFQQLLSQRGVVPRPRGAHRRAGRLGGCRERAERAKRAKRSCRCCCRRRRAALAVGSCAQLRLTATCGDVPCNGLRRFTRSITCCFAAWEHSESLQDNQPRATPGKSDCKPHLQRARRVAVLRR